VAVVAVAVRLQLPARPQCRVHLRFPVVQLPRVPDKVAERRAGLPLEALEALHRST
jgi:hypothetical protein